MTPANSQVELVRVRSLKQTYDFGATFAARLGKGDLVALVGDLGAGKTALARGIALGLGLADARMVSSPTFVLVQEYEASVRVYHIDLYRLAEPEAELEQLGLDEMLTEGVVLVEWADRVERALPRPHWRLDIRHTGTRSRLIEIRRVPAEISE
jgi:tRNA threonylcarbamoyladenosine biosynthesis protein TsaE